MGEGRPLSNTVTLFIFNHLHDWFTFDRYLLNGHYGPGKGSALRMQRSSRQTWAHSNTNIMTAKVQGSMGTQSSGNKPTLEEWIRAPSGCVAINLQPKEWEMILIKGQSEPLLVIELLKSPATETKEKYTQVRNRVSDAWLGLSIYQ